MSNEVGGPYIGTARWLGVPLAPLLREAGVRPGADQLLARSVDGMTIGTPVAALLDGREPLLCVGMNGEPLPLGARLPRCACSRPASTATPAPASGSASWS